LPYVLLAVVLVGAVVFGLARRDSDSVPAAEREPPQAQAGVDLPPDHPPIGNDDFAENEDQDEDEDEPAITWKVPDAWSNMPNPTAMRIATYRVPRAAGDSDDADVSVTRAGGGTEANIERWIGQFEDPKTKRAERTVRGLTITVVEVSGTYLGGGMMGAAPESKKGWLLLGAIVEAPGTPYFFKLTGPSSSVRAARPAFDALLASVTPADGD
jgi:hypothetical protein